MAESTSTSVTQQGSEQHRNDEAQPVMISSGALASRRTFYVYTPPGYDEDRDRRYPVLYLLHGMWGCETDWIYKGDAVSIIDDMIRADELPPTIVVFPSDGLYGDGTFYVDWYDGSGNFEQYFIYDLVGHVDRNYRTSKERHQRGVAGLSMGGYGSLSLALRNPDIWGVAASLSGALWNPTHDQQSFMARMVGPVGGPYEQDRNLYVLAERRLREGNAPAIYFDCGVDDGLIHPNRAFDKHLAELGYEHQYQEFPGAHTWPYWTEHLRDVCRFMSQHFRNS